MFRNLRIAVIAAAAATFAIAPPASAAGCNGVVNIFVWGCAPWDNNNGPQHQYYRKRAVTIPMQGTQIVNKDGRQYAVRNGVTYPLAAGVISNGSSGVISNGSSGVIQVWTQ